MRDQLSWRLNSITQAIIQSTSPVWWTPVNTMEPSSDEHPWLAILVEFDTDQAPVGPFCVPRLFDYRKQPSLSHQDLPWAPVDRFNQLWIRAGGEGDDGEWDAWMAPPTPWIWVWISSGSWWRTGKPGVLQSMGLQRIGHDWVTELNWRYTETRHLLIYSKKKESRAALDQGLVSPEIHTISLSYFADMETPSRWGKLTVNGGMLPTSMQALDQLDLKVDDADSCLPHHQPIRRMSMSWSCPLWKMTLKLLTIFSKGINIVLRA